MIRRILFGLTLVLFCITFERVAAQEDKGLFDEKRKKVELNNYFISLNLQDGLSLISGAVEWKIDSLLEKESDPVIRNNLVSLKNNLINVLSEAAFHSDPLLSALDSWALIYQLVDYFSGERCRSLYGRHCDVLVGLFNQYGAGYQKALGPYLPPENQEQLQSFAITHPIRDDNLNRKTIVPSLSTWLSEDELGLKSGFITMADLMRDMSFRLQYYSRMLPKQTMWQMESALTGYMGPDSVSAMIHDMQHLMRVSAKTLDQAEDMITEQRVEAFKSIRSERIAALGYVSGEREIMLEAVTNERKAMQEFITSERIAMIREMERISDKMLNSTVEVGKKLIDYVFIRTLILFSVLGLIMLAGLYMYKRSRT